MIKNEIRMMIHCGDCLDKVAVNVGQSSKKNTSYQFGWTAWGFQVECKTCDKVILSKELLPSQIPSTECSCLGCKNKNELEKIN